MSESNIKDEIIKLVNEGIEDDKIFKLYEKYKKNIRSSNEKNNYKTTKMLEIIMLMISYAESKEGRFSSFAVYCIDQYPPPSIDYTNIKELVIKIGEKYSGVASFIPTKIPSYLASAYDDEMRTIDISGSELKVIVMPGVTELGHECFSGCNNITKIVLPNTVTRLPSKCLEGTGIDNIYIPPRVKELGEYCFSNCEKLKYVTGMENVSELNDGVFMNCVNLKNVEIKINQSFITERDIFTDTTFRKGSYGLPNDSQILKKLFIKTNRERFFKFMIDKNILNEDCKFETDNDVTNCIIKTFDGGNTGIMSEVLKYIGDECENLGFMKPDNFSDFKKLYILGLRCFDLYNVKDVPSIVDYSFKDSINVNTWPIWKKGTVSPPNSNIKYVNYNSWRTKFDFLTFNLKGNQDDILWPDGEHKGFGKMLDENGVLWGSTLPHEISGSLILDKLVEPIGIVGGFGKVDGNIAMWNETKDIRLPSSFLPDKINGWLKLETDTAYFDSYADEAATFFKVLMGNLEDEDQLCEGEFGEQWNNYNNGKKYVLLGDIQTSFLPSVIEKGIIINQWFPALGFGETSFLTNINGSILFPKYNGFIGFDDTINKVSWLPTKINGDLDMSSLFIDGDGDGTERDFLPSKENVSGKIIV